MLESLLRQEIQEKGPLPQNRYMELALQHPLHGYYRSQEAIGRDFTTSPEISQVFGEVLGLWALDYYTQLNHPEAVTLVELGPGKGTLMADFLRATKQSKPFSEALNLYMVEINPLLKAAQHKALQRPATWVEKFEQIPETEGPLLLIANEFFDALPTQCFQRKDNMLYERCIDTQDDKFVFSYTPLHEDLGEDLLKEDSPEACHLMDAICKRLHRQGGVLLCIDYGYETGSGDTLQALHKGRPSDPLSHIGKADLTCHVHFGRLKEVALRHGLGVLGPLAQRHFLENIGFMVRTSILKQINPQKAEELDLAALRLTHPQHMGSLFKAMAIFSPSTPHPTGFK